MHTLVVQSHHVHNYTVANIHTNSIRNTSSLYINHCKVYIASYIIATYVSLLLNKLVPSLGLENGDPVLMVYFVLCFERLIRNKTDITNNTMIIIKNKNPPTVPPMAAPAVLDLEESA